MCFPIKRSKISKKNKNKNKFKMFKVNKYTHVHTYIHTYTHKHTIIILVMTMHCLFVCQFNETTGVLTISGEASPEAYEDVLRNLTYLNT